MWYCWLLFKLDAKGLEVYEEGGVAASLYSLRVLLYKSSRFGSINNTESASPAFLDFCLEGTLENVGS